jgi:hypothetical protein
VVLGKLQAGLLVLQREKVGCVAVDLVRRHEDEGRLRLHLTSGLQQVERAGRVHAEVGVGLARRPVVGRLRGGVNDQLEIGGVLPEDPHHRVAVPDVGVDPPELRIGPDELVGDVRGGSLRTEEPRPHVVLESDHLPAALDEAADRV